MEFVYFKTLNICGTKFSRFKENDIFVHIKFGGLGAPQLRIIKKI